MSNRSDNFNRANGSIGTPSDGGSAWSVLSGVWEISANNAFSNSIAAHTVASLEASTSDADVQATVVIKQNGCGLAARIADNSNYLRMYVQGADSTMHLYKVVAGVHTLLTEDLAVTYAAGDVIKISCNGTSVKCYLNGVEKLSVTESAGLTNTQHGLYANTSAPTYDDFSITGIGGGGGLPAGAESAYLPGGMQPQTSPLTISKW